ncbi:MAG TPA: ABC transporter substrate-binding protein [Gemmatimonadaceae bacterium]|nr:ABC transporter substrate-binding protein [Gemmatimonadaceae bacterium]
MGADRAALTGALLLLIAGSCRPAAPRHGVEITFSGSALGTEGALIARQVARFSRLHPGIHVRVQPTPDDATQRHQLYVQWLNAHVGDPDVLQLDVIWTAEFAAAGWVLPLDHYHPVTADFFPATVDANRWRDTLYAIPWYADVGMLYWRTDLLGHAPRSLDELMAVTAPTARRGTGTAYGIVWQGARYEGLVTVFLEYLGAFGGRMIADDGSVTVDSPEGIAALTLMREQLRTGRAPPEQLTWHEEETRFAFQNGEALLMRNWPYAYPLLGDSARSRVAGRVGVAVMPAAPGGTPTAALGGSELAINAHSEAPDSAWVLVAYLTAPAQMLERAVVGGYFPTRPALYDDPRLRAALTIPADTARSIVYHSRPRPVTPIYSQLSELLQIRLHRALSGQATPAAALHDAARAMNELMDRTHLRTLMARRSTP